MVAHIRNIPSATLPNFRTTFVVEFMVALERIELSSFDYQSNALPLSYRAMATLTGFEPMNPKGLTV